MPAPLRLFIAYDLSAALLDVFTNGQQQLSDRIDRWRPVPRHNAHCTLRFLGELRADDLPTLQQALEGIPSPAGLCAAGVESWGAFTQPKGRLVWMGLSPSPAAHRLNDALQASIDALNLFPPERRPWWPHVTAARDVRLRGKVEDILAALPRHTQPAPLTHLTLYESRFTPDGMVYLPRWRRPL